MFSHPTTVHCALHWGLHWGRAMPEAPLIPSLVLLPIVKIITLNGSSDLRQLPLQFKSGTLGRTRFEAVDCTPCAEGENSEAAAPC